MLINVGKDNTPALLGDDVSQNLIQRTFVLQSVDCINAAVVVLIVVRLVNGLSESEFGLCDVLHVVVVNAAGNDSLFDALDVPCSTSVGTLFRRQFNVGQLDNQLQLLALQIDDFGGSRWRLKLRNRNRENWTIAHPFVVQMIDVIILIVLVSVKVEAFIAIP